MKNGDEKAYEWLQKKDHIVCCPVYTDRLKQHRMALIMQQITNLCTMWARIFTQRCVWIVAIWLIFQALPRRKLQILITATQWNSHRARVTNCRCKTISPIGWWRTESWWLINGEICSWHTQETIDGVHLRRRPRHKIVWRWWTL